ncbi:DNA polymerase Y family protein (plasmid) [Streptomyces sp. NBC_00445]|uniref:DNA polymerase Y family protein n=1 Tax=Streptomyces sp. NBC_00445 TaxID=2975745 RepID=UPI002E1D8358
MDGRSVVAWLPDFPVIACGGADAEPVAVVDRDVVVACSAAARAGGVRRRMRLRSAQACCPRLRVVERDLMVEMRAFERVAGHLESTVMPRLEVIRPGLLAAPARGPSRYWGGEELLIGRLVAAVAELGLPARAGVADRVFTAALAARRGVIVPVGGDAAWLAPYPVGVLGVPGLAELLERLGIRTVGAYARLPTDKVSARFGAEGLIAHRTARGEQPRPLTVRTGTGECTVTHRFEPAEERLEPVAFAIKALADQLHDRLTAAGLVAARLEVVVDLADGRRLSRIMRHEGRLSSLAVAERVRGLLQAWTETDVFGGGPERGIAALTLRPEQLSGDTGRQTALFGDRHTPEEIERAAARVQAILGHKAVVRMETGGGRAPADRVRLVPFGDVVDARRDAGGPWPGRLPAPHPAATFPEQLPAQLGDASGRPVAVSGRLALSAAPAQVTVEGYGQAAVTGWAGPWPVLERWWDRDGGRRIARMQVTAADGHAWLLVIEQGRWWAEAHYG